MTISVFITIDTEEDDWGDYTKRSQRAENIRQIPLVQELFDRYGAIPTYLVTQVVANDQEAVGILKNILSKGRCDIGAHCHPWSTTPFTEGKLAANSMLSTLKPQTIKAKIESLHNSISTAFDFSPKCFRAGRWAFGPHVARAILDLGYEVDTSVTPFIDWASDGGSDFSTAPTDAYSFDPENVMAPKDQGQLLEVPATIGFLQRPFHLCASVHKRIAGSFLSRFHILGALDRARLLNLRWLSPEESSGQEMVRLCKNLIHRGCNFLNLCFHSTSLLPGKSPFVLSDSELRSFLGAIESFLAFASSHEMRFLGLSEGAGALLKPHLQVPPK
jgi:hypothetical protein